MKKDIYSRLRHLLLSSFVLSLHQNILWSREQKRCLKCCQLPHPKYVKFYHLKLKRSSYCQEKKSRRPHFECAQSIPLSIHLSQHPKYVKCYPLKLKRSSYHQERKSSPAQGQ